MSFCSLTKGFTPIFCILRFCVLINKRSFKPLMCLNASSHSCFRFLFSSASFISSWGRGRNRVGAGERQRQRDRERQRETQGDRDRETETERQRQRDRERERETEQQIHSTDMSY